MQQSSDEVINGCLEKLSAVQKYKLIDFLKTLTDNTIPDGSSISRFAGAIEAEDLKRMKAAISESCEGIDINEW